MQPHSGSLCIHYPFDTIYIYTHAYMHACYTNDDNQHLYAVVQSRKMVKRARGESINRREKETKKWAKMGMNNIRHTHFSHELWFVYITK